MRLTNEKVEALRRKGYIPLLEWCRKNNVTNPANARDYCRRNLIPCLVIDENFFFVPAHAKRPEIQIGGLKSRGLVTGSETMLETTIESAPEAEEIAPKKRGRPAKRKDEK